MEKKCFRENFELLNMRYPEKDMLTRAEVAGVMGVSLKTVQRKITFPKKLNVISKADLARQISV